MARNKLIPDAQVLSIVLDHLLESGQKSVTFAAIAKEIGLAPPTLVQRFGSCSAMSIAALSAAWDQLNAQTDLLCDEALNSGKGVQTILKGLSGPINSAVLLTVSLQEPEVAVRAKAWRQKLEAALTIRFGGGPKGRESAAMTFAAWQGRLLWDGAGGKNFRLGEAIKRLG